VASVAEPAPVGAVASVASVAEPTPVGAVASVASVAEAAAVGAVASVAEAAAVGAVESVAEPAPVGAVASVAAPAPVAAEAWMAEPAAVGAVASVAQPAEVGAVESVAAPAAAGAVESEAAPAPVGAVASMAEAAPVDAVESEAAPAEVGAVESMAAPAAVGAVASMAEPAPAGAVESEAEPAAVGAVESEAAPAAVGAVESETESAAVGAVASMAEPAPVGAVASMAEPAPVGAVESEAEPAAVGAVELLPSGTDGHRATQSTPSDGEPSADSTQTLALGQSSGAATSGLDESSTADQPSSASQGASYEAGELGNPGLHQEADPGLEASPPVEAREGGDSFMGGVHDSLEEQIPREEEAAQIEAQDSEIPSLPAANEDLDAEHRDADSAVHDGEHATGNQGSADFQPPPQPLDALLGGFGGHVGEERDSSEEQGEVYRQHEEAEAENSLFHPLVGPPPQQPQQPHDYASKHDMMDFGAPRPDFAAPRPDLGLGAEPSTPKLVAPASDPSFKDTGYEGRSPEPRGMEAGEDLKLDSGSSWLPTLLGGASLAGGVVLVVIVLRLRSKSTPVNADADEKKSDACESDGWDEWSDTEGGGTRGGDVEKGLSRSSSSSQSLGPRADEKKSPHISSSSIAALKRGRPGARKRQGLLDGAQGVPDGYNSSGSSSSSSVSAKEASALRTSSQQYPTGTRAADPWEEPLQDRTRQEDQEKDDLFAELGMSAKPTFTRATTPSKSSASSHLSLEINALDTVEGSGWEEDGLDIDDL